MALKFLSLKIYYELGMVSVYEQLNLSLLELVRNNKVLKPKQRRLYKIRLDWFRRLFHATLPSKWSELKSKLSDAAYFEDREWMLEKLEGLASKK